MNSNGAVGDGLSTTEARTRLQQVGYNEIRPEPSSLLRSILKRFWGPIPWILEAALVLEILLGKTIEPAIIGGLLVFSAVVGGTQERRARNALDLLRTRLQVTARVRRDGNWQLLPARELVPGDQVRVQVGDIVPADSTISDGSVEVDQSALTGESSAVARSPGETIYSGSTVHRGEAIGLVTATGSQSYYGRTAELVRAARSTGHLEQLLFTVVRYLVAVDAVLAVVLIIGAMWRGEDLLPLLPFLLVLVTATVPVTMAYAVAAGDESTQNPLELAIVQAAAQRSVAPLSRAAFTPFDPANKYSEAHVNLNGQTMRVVLGSPAIVEQLAADQPGFAARVEALAAAGARVLAVAAGADDALILRGLIALADIPRQDAATLVKALQALGIRVIMVNCHE